MKHILNKSRIAFVAFIIVLLIIFSKFFSVFQLKAVDGVYSMTTFYEQRPESIDVIFLGSSHMYENVSTQVLWDEYGMAAFDLGGSVQPIWNTYYYMKEALKTQTPKVLVLDVYMLTKDWNYSDTARAMKNTFGMKYSKDKIEAIKASYEHTDIMQLMDYIFEFPAFHNRYTEITEGDFKGQGKDYNNDGNGRFNCDDWKGYYLNLNEEEQDFPAYSSTEKRLPLGEKQEYYFRKTIELAKEHQIPLVLIISPYKTKEEDAGYYNTISDIADEEDLPFINFNLLYDELQLDFDTDYADGAHMNEKGSRKYSSFLGAYLTDHYSIPDRRGDPAYEDYDRMARWYREQIEK